MQVSGGGYLKGGWMAGVKHLYPGSFSRELRRRKSCQRLVTRPERVRTTAIYVAVVLYFPDKTGLALRGTMELTQFTDYSLRTLIFVALKKGELTSIKEVADAYSISENHLTKIVHSLAKFGYLETFRGRGGGMALGKKPAEIGIGEVVRQLENVAVVECLREQGGSCCIAGICKLQHALHRATQAFFAELDQLTLEDLIENENELLSRLEQ